MRILLLNQTFYPDAAATAQHAHDLARHLVSQGHEVTVVASRSIYGQKGATLAKRERVDGIDVHRVGVSLFGKAGTLARLADFGLFYMVAAWRVLSLGLRPGDGAPPEVVVAFTTPPLIALVGWLNRVLWGSPYVYWLMDLYPDLAVECGVIGRGGVVHRVLDVVSRWTLGRADRVVVLGRCMEGLVLGKGLEWERVVRVPVWADSEEVRPVTAGENRYRREWGLEGKFVVMYSGNLGVGHEVGAICDAMKRLGGRETPGGRGDVRFVFIGGGKKMAEVRAFVEREELGNAMFLGYQPREALAETLSAGDVHLISQLPALTGMIVPSKLMGVLAAGRPVVFVGSAEAEVGQVVAETGCGVVTPAGDGAALAAAIERLAADPGGAAAMGERGRRALEERFDRRIACEAWEGVLGEVLDRSGQR